MGPLPPEAAGRLLSGWEQRTDPHHIGMNVPGCHEVGDFIKIDEIRVVVDDS